MDPITNGNNKNDDKKWKYRMLITGPSGSGKTNAWLKLIQKQDNYSLIDKIYLYVKNLSKPKYRFLIKKCMNKKFKWSKCIYWMFKHYGRCLQQYWSLHSKKKEENFNCVWWYDCWDYD